MELQAKHTRIKNGAETLFIAVCVLITCVGLLLFPQAASAGAKNGLVLCSDVLIPSLFTFMVLSSFIVKSGFSAKLEALLNPVTQVLFGLPGSAGATILLSMVGGYPAGARGVRALLEEKQINPAQANQMLCFCVGAGPAFVVSVIGGGIFKNTKIGAILFFSQVIAALLLGAFSRCIFKNTSKNTAPPQRRSAKMDIATALVESCEDATTGTINMCAFVVLFSSLMMILAQSGALSRISSFLEQMGVAPAMAESIVPLLLEITNGCVTAAKSKASPELVSFAIAWAGICVQFQIFACISEIPVNRPLIIFFRFLHGLLAAAISNVAFRLFPVSVETFSNYGQPGESGLSSTPVGCLALVLLCVCFLLSATPGAASDSRAIS